MKNNISIIKSKFIFFLFLFLFSLNFILSSSFGYDDSKNSFGFNLKNISSSNINSFLDLEDTPSTYTGNASYCLIVNPGENGIIFSICPGAGGGISWAEVINGTVVQLSTLLAFNYYNSTDFDINDYLTTALFNTNYSANDEAYRGATNTSYYLVSNPYGYLNTTINTSYYLATNPFGFYNVTTIGNLPNTNNYWNTTFATFNKTYADTLYAPLGGAETDPYWTSNFTLYNSSWTQTINTSYQLKTNYTDWNETGFIKDWNASGLIKDWGTGVSLATLLGFSYYNSTNPPSWNATNTSYYLVSNPYGYLNTTINTSYYLESNPYNYYNSTNPPPASGNSITAVNVTVGTHNGALTNGSFVGYSAGNSICNLEFDGSHMCTEFEVQLGFAGGVNTLDNEDAWIIAGSPKYIPATVPVNDCQGWMYSGTTTALGNYWHFNQTSGGEGRAINCGSTLKLACCSY